MNPVFEVAEEDSEEEEAEVGVVSEAVVEIVIIGTIVKAVNPVFEVVEATLGAKTVVAEWSSVGSTQIKFGKWPTLLPLLLWKHLEGKLLYDYLKNSRPENLNKCRQKNS